MCCTPIVLHPNCVAPNMHGIGVINWMLPVCCTQDGFITLAAATPHSMEDESTASGASTERPQVVGWKWWIILGYTCDGCVIGKQQQIVIRIQQQVASTPSLWRGFHGIKDSVVRSFFCEMMEPAPCRYARLARTLVPGIVLSREENMHRCPATICKACAHSCVH